MRSEPPRLYPVPAELILGALPALDEKAERLVRILAERGGALISTDTLARRVGLANRQALGRLLRANRLPAPARLAQWIELASFALHYERDGTTIAARMLDAGRDPAVRYRRIERLTGAAWQELQGRGVAWVLERMAAESGRRLGNPRLRKAG